MTDFHPSCVECCERGRCHFCKGPGPLVIAFERGGQRFAMRTCRKHFAWVQADQRAPMPLTGEQLAKKLKTPLTPDIEQAARALGGAVVDDEAYDDGDIGRCHPSRTESEADARARHSETRKYALYQQSSPTGFPGIYG